MVKHRCVMLMILFIPIFSECIHGTKWSRIKVLFIIHCNAYFFKRKNNHDHDRGHKTIVLIDGLHALALGLCALKKLTTLKAKWPCP